MGLPALAIPIITSAISAAGSIFGTKLQNKSQKDLMSESESIWNRQFQNQNQRQDFLNNNAQSIYANSMRQAGFSPLWSNQGGVASTSVSSPSSPSGSSSIGNIFGNIDPASLILANEQKDLIHEQARELKRSNDIKAEKDHWLKGASIPDDFLDTLLGEDWFVKNDGDVISIPFNVATMTAYNELKDFYLSQDDRETKYSSNSALQSLNEFNEAVNRAKSSNPDIINANAKLSLEEFNQLTQLVKNLKSQGVLNDDEHSMNINRNKLLELDVENGEFTKFGPVLEKLFNKDVSFVDKIIGVLGLLFTKIKSR